jgi:hypothetical protein
MKKKVNVGVVPFLGLLIIVITAIVGWVMNLFELFHMIGEPIGTEFIIRIVGIFVAPIGTIMGFFF